MPESTVTRPAPIIYGTAWKDERTEQLVATALHVGFRAIDSANQRKLYYEAAVGNAIAGAIAAGVVRRDELFLQTKFTFQCAQDHRLPHDPAAPIGEQVAQSFASSLLHLQTDCIDSYLLHGPSTVAGLANSDWEAWEAIESLHDSGEVRSIGVSNFTADQLQQLVARARVRPQFVQNRCYESQGWDSEVRMYCQARKIVYQGFSLLTANRSVLAQPAVIGVAERLSCSVAQVVFRFARDIGILPLTGTINQSHMIADLDLDHLELRDEERFAIEHVAGAEL